MSDQAWHDWRAQGIGGSDVPGILGWSSFSSPWSVWADKMGLVPRSEETARQRLGKRMETVLAAEFTDETGLVIVDFQKWNVDHNHPWRRCTVDGLVAECIDPIGVWEAKTDDRSGGLWHTWDNVPRSMRAQITWNAGVTGLRAGWLTVGHGWRLEHINIPYDHDDYLWMADKVDRFWNDHVLTGTPPEIDGSDATTSAIATAWANHDPGTTCDLTDLIELITDRADLRDQAKEIDAALDKIDNTIKAAMGAAEIGTVAGLQMFTYRTQNGRRTECDNCHHVTTGDPFRVLRTKPAPKPAKQARPLREEAA